MDGSVRRRREASRVAGARSSRTPHPNVKLNISSGASTTDELLQKLSAGFASGNYPDISYAFGQLDERLGRVGQDPRHHRAGRRPGGRLVGVPGGGAATTASRGRDARLPRDRRQPRRSSTTPTLRRRRSGLPGRELDLGRLPGRGQGAHRTRRRRSTGRPSPSAAARTRPGTCGPSCGRTAARSSPRTRSRRPSTPTPAWPPWSSGAQMAVDDKSVYLDQTDEKYGPLFVVRPDRDDHHRSVAALRPGQSPRRRTA